MSQGYNFKSDSWSLGCVIYEMCALKSPFASENDNFYTLGKKIRKAEYPPLDDSFSKEVSNYSCLI